jgi:putative zinc finger/helix-turn-helix YgiT family protein
MDQPISITGEVEVMNCFQCAQGQLNVGPVELSGERNGESFQVRMDGLRCNCCGFQTLDNDHASEFTRLVSDAYRKKHGLLTGAEIRARRAGLGMSQLEFAKYLGPGVASVKRWELGQIQDKAMDELIRLKTDPEAAKRNLDDLRRLNAPEQYVLSALPEVDLALSLNDQIWSDDDPRIILAAAGPEDELVKESYVLAA